MLFPRIVNFLYIFYKLAFNLALVPSFFLKNRRLFVFRHLHDLVNGVINLQVSYNDAIETVDLVELQSLLHGPDPRLDMKFSRQYGNILFDEALAIAYMVQAIAPRKLFEIGTFDGYSTWHLARNSPADAVIHTLNLPPDASLRDYAHIYSLTEYHDDVRTHESLGGGGVGRIYRESDVASKVRQHYGNSLDFDFAPFRGGMEFIFIDGGHSYRHIESDTRNALMMLAGHGIIVWHDYNVQHRDVRHFLTTLSRSHKLRHIAGTRLVFLLKPETPSASP